MKTVFSGIQPSGELHLGNYLGAIRNWVALQDQYQCVFSVVDYHAITQPYEPKEMRRRVFDMVTDLIACGIDPERSILFVQSQVPEHTELCWILNTVTPFGDLSRMTQFKDKAQRQADNINAGLFDYPVLQTADIILYKATAVPVGADQVQHIELARRIVRAFNRRWGKVFPEPEPVLSSTPKILGLDGKAKMSKSIGNTIALSEDERSIRKKLARAATDPARVTRDDPGDPDKCNVYTLHTFFSDDACKRWVRDGCTTAGIGCKDCKTALADNIVSHLAPIQARKAQLAADPDGVADTLARGAARAKEIASRTMAEVRDKLGLWP
ncbi:MAG: tryptophan--tRNA ligase [Deltaproteobacteria bacterium]|nr:MAG: tryptophan--tRNA ligase [Deltaproteobacteria bacterium]